MPDSSIKGKPISELPKIEILPDDSFFVAEFLNKAYKLPGAVIRKIFEEICKENGSVGGIVAELTGSSGAYNVTVDGAAANSSALNEALQSGANVIGIAGEDMIFVLQTGIEYTIPAGTVFRYQNANVYELVGESYEFYAQLDGHEFAVIDMDGTWYGHCRPAQVVLYLKDSGGNPVVYYNGRSRTAEEVIDLLENCYNMGRPVLCWQDNMAFLQSDGLTVTPPLGNVFRLTRSAESLFSFRCEQEGTEYVLEVNPNGFISYVGEVSGGGVSDYTELENKPKINGVELSGNKTTQDLGITPTDAQVANAVETWLDAHPEATTTVEDGSITYEKLDGVEVVANQIFDPVDFRTNGVTKYLNASGTITSTTAITDGYSGYMTSPYIEVLPNTDYAMNFTTYRMFFYDSSQVMLEAASITEVKPVGGTTYYRITTPANTAYIRFTKNFSIDSGEHETWMICEGGVLFEEYFVGKKTALNGECLNLKENTLDGASIAEKTMPANRVKDFDILQQLFNYDDFVNKGVAGGNVTVTGAIAHGNEASYHCSDFVPAKAEQVYTTNFRPHISGKEYGAVACYGADKVCLGLSDLNSDYQFTTLADTVYVRFGLYAFGTLDVAENYMICEGTELFPGYAEGGDQIIVKNLLLYHSAPQNSIPGTLLLDGSIPASKLAPADGLKVLCYGDSLTQNLYPAKVATLLNAEVTDAGIGGNTVAQIHNRVGNYGTDYTVVTLMCGTNDNGGQTSCPLGTADDEAATDDNATAAETTYASRLKRLLNKIKTAHRGATFVIMPPFAHAWGGETFESVSVLMGEIAKQYKMPFLDIYHLCGWDGTDEEDKAIFMADGTHENDVGAQRIAELLAGFIKQLKGA